MVRARRPRVMRMKPGAALLMHCRALGLPEPVAEFRFHATRRWRFDFAWPNLKLAVEIDGGAFIPGGSRHTRGAGYRADCEKLAEAAIAGWRVIRCLPEHVTKGDAVHWIDQAIRRAQPEAQP